MLVPCWIGALALAISARRWPDDQESIRAQEALIVTARPEESGCHTRSRALACIAAEALRCGAGHSGSSAARSNEDAASAAIGSASSPRQRSGRLMRHAGRDAGSVQCRRRGPATLGPPRLLGPWRDVCKRMPYRLPSSSSQAPRRGAETADSIDGHSTLRGKGRAPLLVFRRSGLVVCAA
jgi:hypothetical protein